MSVRSTYDDGRERVNIPMMTLEGGALSGFEHLARQLRSVPNAYNAALVGALNRAAVTARSEAAKLIRKRYTLKTKYINRGFILNKASYRYPTVRFYVRAKRGIHLSDWGARAVRGGVRVQIHRGGRATFLADAFLGRGINSGKTIVFKSMDHLEAETGATSRKVKALYTTTGYEFLSHSRIKIYIANRAEKSLAQNAVRNMEFQISKMKAKK